VLGALAVTGCAPVRSGAAAVIGERRVSTEDVRVTADELTAQARTVDRAAAVNASLTYLVQLDVMTEVARRQSPPVTVSDTDVARLRSQLLQQTGGQQGLDAAFLQQRVPRSQQDAYLRLLLLRQRVGQRLDPGGAADGSDQTAVDRQVAQVSRELHVRVSPRYGRWDAATGVVQQEGSGGLATAATPTPSPLASTG
jgi:hypothetical protein